MTKQATSLPRSLSAWSTASFSDTLKQELQSLPIDALPLQQGLTHGSYVLDETRTVMVISTWDDEAHIYARVGVFFSGLLGGCSCADDPSPVEASNEYCELEIILNKATSEATARLVAN